MGTFRSDNGNARDNFTDLASFQIINTTFHFLAMQMVEQALRAFVQQIGVDSEEFYPVHQGNTQEVQVLSLMAKKPRNVFLRPFKTKSLVPLGGLDTYMNRSKKEEYQNAVYRLIKKEDLEVTLEPDEDNEKDEGDDAAPGR